MSIQVLASVKKGKPELRKKVQLCQQCLIYISIYLMLLQHCFYTFEELNNIALSIHIIYINIFYQLTICFTVYYICIPPGDARCDHPTEEDLQKKGRPVHLLRGQCR